MYIDIPSTALDAFNQTTEQYTIVDFSFFKDEGFTLKEGDKVLLDAGYNRHGSISHEDFQAF
jgi:hypothetical protein